MNAADREAFYKDIDAKNLAPLWVVLSDLITPEPRSRCQPARWRFEDVRASMVEAGELITAKEAERRVLILENPGLRGESKVTTSLYAGIQLLLPGEVAPVHRHAQSALRFILEGTGAHTSVNGVKTMMEFGDFLTTPPMAWHQHTNDTDTPMFWLDGLDIPLVSLLDASFAEGPGEDVHPFTSRTGQPCFEFCHGLLPVDAKHSHIPPVLSFPYARSRETLEANKRGRDPDLHHGWKLYFANPLDGRHAMPTIATFIQLLPVGATAPYRATDATVFVCAEGRGRSRIGQTDIEWSSRDVFVVPSWQPVVHQVAEEAVLFSFSDRVVQEKLGLWREARVDA